MKKLKLTNWYKPNQKPIRMGYYECKCCQNRFFWDGKNWLSKLFDGELTEIREGWRGIAK